MNMPVNNAEFKPTRRNLLTAAPAAGLAAMMAGAVPVAAAAEQPHDPIPGWYAEWQDERDAYNNGGPNSAYDRMVLLEQRIYGEWPRSIEGVVAKLSWMLETGTDAGEWNYTGHVEALHTAIAGLKSGAFAGV